MAKEKEIFTENENRQKALETTISEINKRFGKGSLVKLGENAHMQLEHISSGCLSLDNALGIGGYPKGRIIEISPSCSS